MKILRVTSTSDAFVHIKKQLETYGKEGKDITLLSNEKSANLKILDTINLSHLHIDMRREISLLDDLLCLFALIKILKKTRPDILHSSTPKAGLLCSLAGFIARTPIRIHTFTGQRWATLTGFKKLLLKSLDKLVCILNTKVYSDSPSQNQFLIDSGVVKKEKISCLGIGSLGGIDLSQFDISDIENRKAKLREQYGIANDCISVLYLGRVTKDKGINELVRVFNDSQIKNKNIELHLVGPYEPDLDPLEKETDRLINESKNIKAFGKTNKPQDFFALSDIFCIPSYREGFGTVVLEASAMSLPSIGTRIPGLLDSIEEGKTGLLIEKNNISELRNAILELFKNHEKRITFGKNARRRAEENFSSEIISDLQWKEYEKLFSSKDSI